MREVDHLYRLVDRIKLFEAITTVTKEISKYLSQGYNINYIVGGRTILKRLKDCADSSPDFTLSSKINSVIHDLENEKDNETIRDDISDLDNYILWAYNGATYLILQVTKEIRRVKLHEE